MSYVNEEGRKKTSRQGARPEQRKRQRKVLRTRTSDYKQVIIPGGKDVVGGVSCLLHCRKPPIAQLIC